MRAERVEGGSDDGIGEPKLTAVTRPFGWSAVPASAVEGALAAFKDRQTLPPPEPADEVALDGACDDLTNAVVQALGQRQGHALQVAAPGAQEVAHGERGAARDQGRHRR